MCILIRCPDVVLMNPFSFILIFLQEEVYTKTSQPLIQTVVNGFNATVFAYGATGKPLE